MAPRTRVNLDISRGVLNKQERQRICALPMEHRIVLGELRKSRWVIDCFMLKNGALIVVEPEQIKKAIYSNDLKYEDMATVAGSGYNIAASVYWEPLTGEEYLLILKDCGVLELLNSRCSRVDILETGIRQYDDEKFFMFDDINHLYLNLTKCAIFAIEYQVKNKEMSFVKKDEELKCIFHDVNRIIDMDLTWNVDYFTGRDFHLISVLLKNDISKECYFQVIRQLKTNTGGKMQPWNNFINGTTLTLDGLDSASHQVPILKTVPNVGLFIFTPLQVLFVKSPEGYEQTVGGSKFNSYESFDGLIISYDLAVMQEDRLDLCTEVMVKRNVNSLEFWAFTLRNQIVKFTLKVNLEDPEEFIIHWDMLSCEKLTVAGLEPNQRITSRPQRSIFLSNVIVFLINESEGVLCVDLKKLQVVNRLAFNLSKVLHSDTVGTDIHKYVSCGGSITNTGFIKFKFWGYSNPLSLTKSFSSEHEITDLWEGDQGIWWKNSNGQIFCEGELIETVAQTVYVTSNGIILKNKSMAIWANIVNDSEGNYSYISNNGDIGWSDEDERASLGNLKSSSLVRYILSCSKLDDGSKITVLSVDSKITVLKNTQMIKRDIDLSDQLDSISSISIVPNQNTLHIFICDIDGQLCELDFDSSNLCCKLKIGAQKANICAIPNCASYFVYTKDDLMLISPTEANDYQIAKLDVKHRISKIVARNSSNIVILEDDHMIYRYNMSANMNPPHIITKNIFSNSHFHTKFISLSCSTRYIITSSLRSEYSELLKREKYYAELQLHDLETQKTVFRYELSRTYPQAIISDIVALPFLKETKFGNRTDQTNLWAMKLAFDRVFMVSLNYEMAEEESLDNLLLFSLDDNTARIDFLQGIETGHSISALHSCDNRIVLAAGDVLQAYQIDYTVKENTFTVKTVSNEVYNGGLIKDIVRLPSTPTPQTLPTKRRKLGNHASNLINEKIVVLNVLKGLREYNLSWNSDKSQVDLRITPVVNVEKIPLFVPSESEADHLITFLSICRIKRTTWFAVGYSDKVFSLFCIPDKEEPSLLKMTLPGHITSVCSIYKGHSPFYLERKDSFIKFGRQSLLILFVVNTFKGEYAVAKVESHELSKELETYDSKEMNEQFKFIQLVNEQPDLIFIDTRVLPNYCSVSLLEKALV